MASLTTVNVTATNRPWVFGGTGINNPGTPNTNVPFASGYNDGSTAGGTAGQNSGYRYGQGHGTAGETAPYTINVSGFKTAMIQYIGGQADLSPVPAGTAPNLITGLLGWYKAGDIVSTDGAALTGWNDSGSGGYNMTGTATYKATVANGFPAVRFLSGSSNGMTLSSVMGLTGTQGRTFWAVAALNTSTTARCPIIGQAQSGSSSNYNMIDANTFSSAGSKYGVYTENSTYDSGTATDLKWHVHVLTFSSITNGGTILSAMAYYVDGVLQTLTLKSGGTTWPQDFSAGNATTIGRYGGVAIFGSVDVAECGVYNSGLSGTNVTNLTNYLLNKYGFTGTSFGPSGATSSSLLSLGPNETDTSGYNFPSNFISGCTTLAAGLVGCFTDGSANVLANTLWDWSQLGGNSNLNSGIYLQIPSTATYLSMGANGTTLYNNFGYYRVNIFLLEQDPYGNSADFSNAYNARVGTLNASKLAFNPTMIANAFFRTYQDNNISTSYPLGGAGQMFPWGSN